MSEKNKLFVWFNTQWCPDYGCDGVFVLAPDVATARQKAQSAQDWRFGIKAEARVECSVEKAPDLVLRAADAVYFLHSE